MKVPAGARRRPQGSDFAIAGEVEVDRRPIAACEGDAMSQPLDEVVVGHEADAAP